jgi:hypothetical protein
MTATFRRVWYKTNNDTNTNYHNHDHSQRYHSH